MEVSIKGLFALRHLRRDLQDNAGLNFPQATHREMLILYDVCKGLDLNLFQCKEVLGEVAWRYVNNYLETPIELSKRNF